jgi:hypothetical protein
MFSRLQGRPRAISLATLAVLTIIVGILTGSHLFNLFTPHQSVSAIDLAPKNGSVPPDALRWSKPATWQGKLPASSAAVIIPAGRTILLDTNPPPLKSLLILGTLMCAEKDLSLSADWIMIHGGGALQCGSEQQPFQHRFVITLTGNNRAENIMGMGTKLLGVMGGRLDLHGQSRVSWAHLAQTAYAGTLHILLDQPVDWRKGDHIVLASTDYDPLQAEEVVVRAVSGSSVTLKHPLQYMHWGQIQRFAGQSLDERAEVGLLSHNIVVQGDRSSVKTGFGGQSMLMSGSTVHIQGVEFHHMGQLKHLARYPVHWHIAGDAAGNYIRGSSVDHSFNRCITIHGTNNLQVIDNVAFDNIGHCYFMEDGSETHDLFKDNLGILTRKPAEGMNLLPSDVSPATFWITNPNNMFIGNVAAGSQGKGFWFALPEHPTGLSSKGPHSNSIWPRQTPLGKFNGNVAHSNEDSGLWVDDGPNPDGTTDGYYYTPVKHPGSDSPPVDAFFQDFTAYKHRFLGVWMRGDHLHLSGAILADNGDGAIFAAHETFLENALVVGESDNKGNPAPGDARGLDGRSLPAPWEPATPLNGFSFYDGRIGVKNVTFFNFQSNSQRPSGALSYYRQNNNPINVLNFVQGIRLVNANAVYMVKPSKDGDRAAVILDVDGSITNQSGRYVVANNPILADGACAFKPAWNSFVCKHHYVNISLYSVNKQQVIPFTISREDGVTASQSGMDGIYVSVSAIPEHVYTLHYPQPATTLQLDLQHTQAGDWVELVIPYSSAHCRLYRDAEHNSPLSAAQSLAAFNASQGSTYFYDQKQGLLSIKLIPRNGNDWARVNVEPA